MTTSFILIRHGQTEWNRQERFRGHADIPLNETGKTQARQVAQRLAPERIDALYASPLRRTVQTAEPIAASHGLELVKEDALVDLDVGALEGQTVDEARLAFPEVMDKWLNAPRKVKFPKGESIKSVRARSEKLLGELAAKHAGQTVALVTHRVLCHTVLCVVLGLDLDALWTIRQDNACIDRFEKQEHGYLLTLMNDTSHLST